MIVYEFDNETKCNNLEELQEVLRNRSKNNSNDFEIRPDQGFPFLTILIKDELACVHYFRDETDCGHYAYIDDNEVAEEYIVFNIGSENSVTEISKDLVIPVAVAYIAAMDFYNTKMLGSNKIIFDLHFI